MPTPAPTHRAPSQVSRERLYKSLYVQSIPKEINPDYSLEGLMLKLKL